MPVRLPSLHHTLNHRERLVSLLSQDLDFHGQDSGYASHHFHAFPAKFPPQLPRKFINALTAPGDVVLDPMMGSGTTVLESLLAGRRGMGFDIDPLALKITQVKITPLNIEHVLQIGSTILERATLAVENRQTELADTIERRWDSKTRQFIDYWFTPETQIELLALITEIETLPDPVLKTFFELVFSAIIITKSGGVSMALDLAHTRPHRAKIVLTKSGRRVLDDDLSHKSARQIDILTKKQRLPLAEFNKRLEINLNGSILSVPDAIRPLVMFGNSQSLPLHEASIDLIVTSPPYAANAIDYMRAHKFSLVWMRRTIDELGKKRKEYIGGEVVTGINYETLPRNTAKLVQAIADCDQKKGHVLHRYYSEMTRALQEMFRVLKPGKAAIVVVGSSTMRGKDTETQSCLAEIGQAIGFEVPKIGVRHLDRNRRMMPAGTKLNLNSQIQQRMHKEYVIGFYKPKD